jgi:thiamine phosphate synthase YjbQ (UPF0047 family)
LKGTWQTVFFTEASERNEPAELRRKSQRYETEVVSF